MERATLQSDKKQYVSKTGPRSTTARFCNTQKKLRLFDIEKSKLIKEVIKPLTNQENQLLFQLNTIHNKKFNTDIILAPNLVSNYLVNALTRCFDIPNSSHIGIDLNQNQVVVYKPLKFDFYNLDLSKLVKLKMNNPLLFNACAILFGQFKIAELDETRYYDEYSLDWYVDLNEMKIAEWQKIERKILKGKKIAEQIRNIQNNNDRNILKKELQNYNPTNPIFKKIQAFLLKWYDQSFSFMNSFPYQYYESQDPTINNEIEIDERIFVTINDTEFFESILEENQQNCFNNYELYEPCWVINKAKADTALCNQIHLFDVFIEDFIKLNQIL